jgi:hypothetical protein
LLEKRIASDARVRVPVAAPAEADDTPVAVEDVGDVGTVVVPTDAQPLTSIATVMAPIHAVQPRETFNAGTVDSSSMRDGGDIPASHSFDAR